jgi:AraC-like DNA-binding protein
MTVVTIGAERRTVYLWPAQAAYLGPPFHLDRHATPVHCLALGVDAPFTVSTAEGSWQRRSALIPARTVHKVEAGVGRMLFYYLDPRSRDAVGVRVRMNEDLGTITTTHRDEPALLDYIHHADTIEADQLRRIVVGDSRSGFTDPRIRTAMESILAEPARDLDAATLAAAAGLSTSRFLHLFSTNAGTSFRRFRLWARLLHLAAALAEDACLTDAAADAGFASASHFSDTFRAMFGLTATTVLKQGTEIVVIRK